MPMLYLQNASRGHSLLLSLGGLMAALAGTASTLCSLPFPQGILIGSLEWTAPSKDS